MARCEPFTVHQVLQSKWTHAIDELGEKSARAQHLVRPITSTLLLQQLAQAADVPIPGNNQANDCSPHCGDGSMQKVFLAFAEDQEIDPCHKSQHHAVGFLKTGPKHLFYVTPQGHYLEMDMTCVLDFFVEESYQRQGIGLQLFQTMLQAEQLEPVQLAYDRPSPKLMQFLARHFGLSQFVPQPNRFVVFDGFVSQSASNPTKAGSSLGHPQEERQE